MSNLIDMLRKIPVTSFQIQKNTDDYFIRLFKLALQSFDRNEDLRQQIMKDALIKLNILREALEIDPNCKSISDDDIKVFQWDYESYLERLHPEGEYLNMLQYENPETVLISKILTDIRNAEVCLNKIINDVPEGLKYLQDCLKVDILTTTIRWKHPYLEMFKSKIGNKMKNHYVYEAIEMRRADSLIHNIIERTIDDELVSNPIETRYSLNFYQNKTNEYECKQTILVDKLTDDIKKLLTHIEFEETIHKSIISYYESDISTLRKQIAWWSDNYNRKLENAESALHKTNNMRERLDQIFMENKSKLDIYNEKLEKAKRAVSMQLESVQDKTKKKAKKKKY